jgi:diguanylate cyclase (GGDEF)-like protein/PAS domain S-box-containing protein
MSKAGAARSVAMDVDSVAQLKLAETYFSHSVSCLVLLDRDYNFVRVNQAYADACRRDINDFVGHNHFDLYPSDAKAIFDDVVRTKSPYVTFTRAFEFADQPERGVTYWDWTLVPVLDSGDDIEYLVFSLVEVTERKRAEEALRIASLVYHHSSEAMMVTDGANNILAINASFTRLTGYAAIEVVGKNPRLFHSGLQDAAFYQRLYHELEENGHWQGELVDRARDGSLIALRLVINTVFDEHGKVERRVALFTDITEKRNADRLIWNQANIDSLTGLPNRHLFHDRLCSAIGNDAANRGAQALLLIDLDQFKEINYTLGHEVGDLLLIEVTRRLSAAMPGGAILGRLGGDEFALLVQETSDAPVAATLAQAIIDALAAPVRLGVDTLFVSASVGIALFPQHGTQAEQLLRHANQAMYAAKNGGRHQYCLFADAMEEAALLKLSLTNDLRGAIAANELEVYYQPIATLGSTRIDKAEALLRWRHPQRGMVSPAEFIALAEASGQIIDIGDWVFRQAAQQVQRLRRLGHTTFQISVNVSPVQFHNQRDLGRHWLAHMAELGLPANSIVLEITEGLLLDLSDEVTTQLLAFAEAGIQVALDDFGTGYSSLAYLTKFDIDYLKIDRAFVRNLDTDGDDRTLCEAIIAMAHTLGLTVIAEGVETPAQRDVLAAAGCDFAQGYLFSRPLPSAVLESLLLP